MMGFKVKKMAAVGWVVAVAVYGGGLQGEKTLDLFLVSKELKSSKTTYFFVFIL